VRLRSRAVKRCRGSSKAAASSRQSDSTRDCSPVSLHGEAARCTGLPPEVCQAATTQYPSTPHPAETTGKTIRPVTCRWAPEDPHAAHRTTPHHTTHHTAPHHTTPHAWQCAPLLGRLAHRPRPVPLLPPPAPQPAPGSSGPPSPAARGGRPRHEALPALGESARTACPAQRPHRDPGGSCPATASAACRPEGPAARRGGRLAAASARAPAVARRARCLRRRERALGLIGRRGRGRGWGGRGVGGAPLPLRAPGPARHSWAGRLT
jgi:hypothetical protein